MSKAKKEVIHLLKELEMNVSNLLGKSNISLNKEYIKNNLLIKSNYENCKKAVLLTVDSNNSFITLFEVYDTLEYKNIAFNENINTDSIVLKKVKCNNEELCEKSKRIISEMYKG